MKPSEMAWTPALLQQLNDRFNGQEPQEILRWGLETFGPDIALATSFGPTSIVLMHLIRQIRPETTIFYLDTDLLFPETYALRDELAGYLELQFTRLCPNLSLEAQVAQYGPALWACQPNLCCCLRKMEPLRCFLATQRAWITGVRRDQTSQRASAELVEWDQIHGLVKLNPLVSWSMAQVWAYIDMHNLPFNPLHQQNYPSIGCWPCTQAVGPGQDARAGRWPGWDKSECGIHMPQTTLPGNRKDCDGFQLQLFG
jgi:phosphoadenosine phosphosulfate reductase